MEQVREKIDWKLWIISIVMGLIVTPAAVKLPFISRIILMSVFLVIINGGLSIWIGNYLSNNRRGWSLFIFPVVYLVGAYFFAPHYTWYFAIIYLGVSYLSWSLTRNN